MMNKRIEGPFPMPLSSCYIGAPPLVAFLENGREVKLLSDFGFYDSSGEAWLVPKDATVDGASIPQIFWSIIGGPFEGKYRDASIIHDWYCDVRTRTWEATHRIFYEAMIVSGVAELKAKTMYFAVRWMGPRWEARTRANTELALTLGRYLEPYQNNEVVVWDDTGVYRTEQLSPEILEAIREKRPFTPIRIAGDPIEAPAWRAPIFNRAADSKYPNVIMGDEALEQIIAFVSKNNPDLDAIDALTDTLRLGPSIINRSITAAPRVSKEET